MEGERPASRIFRRAAGFTLLELLIVLALLLVLMLLLLPAADVAQEHAREIKCMANQRELVLGCLWYAADHNQDLIKCDFVAWGSWPANTPAPQTVASVTNGTLYPYVKSIPTYLCPTFYRLLRATYPNTVISYAINRYVNNTPLLSQVKAPADRVYLTEQDSRGMTIDTVDVNGNTSIDGFYQSFNALNDGTLDPFSGYGDYFPDDCPGTYHRKRTALVTYFDAHVARFYMGTNMLWKNKFDTTRQGNRL